MEKQRLPKGRVCQRQRFARATDALQVARLQLQQNLDQKILVQPKQRRLAIVHIHNILFTPLAFNVYGRMQSRALEGSDQCDVQRLAIIASEQLDNT